MNITPLIGRKDLLGECPIWDAQKQSLYWVDAVGRLVHRYEPSSGNRDSWSVPSVIGSIALAQDGCIILALEDGFYRLDTGSDAIELIASLQHPAEKMRLNDGRTDRQGRFLSGSMVVGRHDREGALYRLNLDGSVEILDNGIAISNSICFSPKGDRLYYSDSLAHTIYTRTYDTVSGEVGPREDFVHTLALGSAPDGATVDAEGYLWVALVQSGKLARFSPDGALERQIMFPTTFVSCPCFGGADLDILYVTTISNSGNLLVATDEGAGYVYEITGLGISGIEEVRFGGARKNLEMERV
ncbi:SMP-30/gluconolactonase/LRE family protein [Glaciimonas sp. Gout2]|uniref:SMP-30/gluconolactonase/LRE family protein n=1 Tax=unclassified Glaciimonas TaxID=2644401 RepID=UPI002B2237C0|nr:MULTISPECIES: SMP-30/gluconolactonase/LRE family protein [unclassified Glaciimonas]MEB0012957.1 SMP-30/gluconolactonase/LRE family protein [Glaciimonas sp. Cout2]MEB0082913.1 SMP-30/gluconolactonase/LRE family protein [Glaciimonas sp. Gout2]